MAQLLHQRTEGNPLFMLNMTDYLMEHDQLVTRDGQWAFTESTALLNISSGLQPFIELRIDQLQAEERELLEVASVAGDEFSVGSVAAALGADIRAIERQCDTLVRQERFIERRVERNYPDGTVTARYGFLHLLYQETLYARLPLTRRIELHGHLGSWEEAAYGAQAPGIAAELAMHFERGRRYVQAIDYHQHAAELAIRQVANQQAIGHLTTALELLSQLPETAEHDQREIALQSSLNIPFLITKGYTAPEVEAACGRARELCRQYPQAPQLFSVLFGLMRFYSTTGKNDVGREIAEQMRALAQQVGDPTWMMLAYGWLGGSAANAGDLVRAHDDLTQSLSRYDHPQHKDLFYQYSDPTGVVVCTYLMYVLWFRGYPGQSEFYAQKAMIWADDIAHPFVVAGANFFGAFSACFCGDAQRAEHHANITLTLATEHQIVNFEALAHWCYGWARFAQGHIAEGLGQMQSGLALARQIGFQLFIPDGLLVQAQCYLQAGKIEDGLGSLTEAAKIIEQSNMRVCEAELYRLRGEFLLARAQQRHLVDVNHPDQREADDCFQRALEIASQQGAKSWTLRATISQCRFWQQQGCGEDAYRALKTVYDEFTEGFVTQDLQDAKALLAELAASQSA